MKIIIGLGNPEPEYSWTRHNAGKEIVNLFVKDQKVEIGENAWKSFRNDIEYMDLGYIKIAKPLCYMNEAGKAVSAFVRFYKVAVSNIMIIYDELDLKIGTYKLTQGKGSNIHNGVKSVEQYMDPEAIWHFRIGVREPEIKMSVQKAGKDPSKYVLQKLPISHRKQILKLYENSLNKELSGWLSKDL